MNINDLIFGLEIEFVWEAMPIVEKGMSDYFMMTDERDEASFLEKIEIREVYESDCMMLAFKNLTIKDLEIINFILKRLKEFGAQTDDVCGLHIQVASEHYSAQLLLKLLYLVMYYEPILYKILNVDENRKLKDCMLMDGSIKRPIRLKARHFLMEIALEEVQSLWMDSLWANVNEGKERQYGLNLKHAFDNTDPFIEFRYFN